MPNTAEGNRVISYIAAHPEQHDQREWFSQAECGTIACFAGTTVLLNGYKPSWFTRCNWTWDVTRKGRHYNVVAVAQHILGLSDIQATILFQWCATLEQIKLVWEWISCGADDQQLLQHWNSRDTVYEGYCRCDDCYAYDTAGLS